MINRQRYKYWNKKVLIKTLIVPFAIFALLCLIVLNLDTTWYANNFATLNHWILSFDANAQTWVNISVSFRDKMILVYLAYQIMYIITFAKLAHYAYTHRNFLLRLIRLRANSRNVDLVAETFATATILVLAIVIILFANSGSPAWMEYADLDNSSSIKLFTDYSRMSTVYGFLINKFAEIGVIWTAIFFCSLYATTAYTRVFKLKK